MRGQMKRRADIVDRNDPDLFEVALRTGGLGAWETDHVAGTRSWTACGAEIFGLDVPIETPIPFETRDHLREVMHPDDRGLLSDVRALLLTQDEVEVAYRIRHPETGLRHIAGRGRVVHRDEAGAPRRVVHIVSDVTERYDIETRNLMLMRELTHRTKNQLAIVMALARRLGRNADSFEEFEEAFTRRVAGMAASIDALVEPVWGSVPLKALIHSHLDGYCDGARDSVVLSGEDLYLDPCAGEALGMALHELASNARQHGALSQDGGRILIAWKLTRGADGGRQLTFEWMEKRADGPATEAGPPGFGSAVLTAMTEAALSAEVAFEMRETGAYWAMTAPVTMPGGTRSERPSLQLVVRPN